MISYKTRKAFESPIYRRNRLAARLLLKAGAGKKLKESEKALAAHLARDPAAEELLRRAARKTNQQSGSAQPLVQVCHCMTFQPAAR